VEFDIVRAWKDASYRRSLTSEQQALLPENPVGSLELTDADLEDIQGSDGGDNIGSISLTGECLISFGGTCITFARITVNCQNINAGSPPGLGVTAVKAVENITVTALNKLV
jgi:mersacidin/lichenicidin family type 2 lantibiotic